MAQNKGEFIVRENEVSLRLDSLIFSHALASSRTRASTYIDSGYIFVNGKQESAHYKVRIGDIISYQIPTKKPLEIVKEDLPFSLIYEDEDLLIINKPRGLVVHPGNGHEGGTLVNALAYRYGDAFYQVDALRPGIVHRIDKDTTGLLAVAKSERAFISLSNQLKDHSMHREYLALVTGNFPGKEGRIDAPIGRKKDDPIRFAVTKDGKAARTDFVVEEAFATHSLLRCRLYTGRTHQIRVHMDYIHHPIEGDPLYGTHNHSLFSKGQLLHAAKLYLKHPSDGRECEFEAPLPEDFSNVLSLLRGKNS